MIGSSHHQKKLGHRGYNKIFVTSCHTLQFPFSLFILGEKSYLPYPYMSRLRVNLRFGIGQTYPSFFMALPGELYDWSNVTWPSFFSAMLHGAVAQQIKFKFVV